MSKTNNYNPLDSYWDDIDAKQDELEYQDYLEELELLERDLGVGETTISYPNQKMTTLNKMFEKLYQDIDVRKQMQEMYYDSFKYNDFFVSVDTHVPMDDASYEIVGEEE